VIIITYLKIDYNISSFFSLRLSNATSRAEKTHFTPTPYSVKCALIDRYVNAYTDKNLNDFMMTILPLKIYFIIKNFVITKSYYRSLKLHENKGGTIESITNKLYKLNINTIQDYITCYKNGTITTIQHFDALDSIIEIDDFLKFKYNRLKKNQLEKFKKSNPGIIPYSKEEMISNFENDFSIYINQIMNEAQKFKADMFYSIPSYKEYLFTNNPLSIIIDISALHKEYINMLVKLCASINYFGKKDSIVSFASYNIIDILPANTIMPNAKFKSGIVMLLDDFDTNIINYKNIDNVRNHLFPIIKNDSKINTRKLIPYIYPHQLYKANNKYDYYTSSI